MSKILHMLRINLFSITQYTVKAIVNFTMVDGIFINVQKNTFKYTGKHGRITVSKICKSRNYKTFYFNVN